MTVALDTETCLIAAGKLAPELVCVTTCGESLQPSLMHWTDSFETVRELFRKEQLVLQNGAYDMAVLAAQYPALLPDIFEALFDSRVVDTRLNQRLIDLAQGQLDGYKDRHGTFHKRMYSLDALSQLYGFGAMEKDLWRLRYGELRSIPLAVWPEGAKTYATTDALRTYQVYAKQQYYEEFLVDAPAQARAAFALHLMSCRGIVTDLAACDKFIASTREDIARARALLEAKGLTDPNGKRNMKPAREYMTRVCNDIGIPVPMTKPSPGKSPDWQPSVCLDAEACSSTGDPVLAAYSTYTSASTLIKKAELLRQGAFGTPLQTSYEPLLETGRTSSRAPMPPMVGDNFQNIRRAPGMRECFIPRPGYVLCSVDYSMAELRTVAQICLWVLGRSELAKALNAGQDVHCVLAANMLGESYDWTIANKKDPRVKEYRQLAKPGNFGAWGGLGPKAFVAFCAAQGTRISEAQARMVLDTWKATWPETTDYFAWIQKMLGDGQATYRAFVSGRVRGNINFTTAANNGFQALAADAAKSALLPIAYECYVDKSSALYGSRPLLFIHDEVIAELPESSAHEAAYRLRDLMVQCFNKYVPDVPVTAEPAIARRWYKEMETLLVDGRLTCWEPVPQKLAA